MLKECVEEDEDQNNVALEFDPFSFIKHLPPLSEIPCKKVAALPIRTRSTPGTLTLVLGEFALKYALNSLDNQFFQQISTKLSCIAVFKSWKMRTSVSQYSSR